MFIQPFSVVSSSAMGNLSRARQADWREFVGSYGLWAVAVVLGGLGIVGLVQ